MLFLSLLINTSMENKSAESMKESISTRPLWRSLDEIEKAPNVAGEFTPAEEGAGLFESNISRRSFMAFASASMALTAAACRRPDQQLVPSIQSLPNHTPGLPLFYSTVYSQGNVAYGAVVKTREGRPLHVRGNPDHPANCGKASTAMMASLLGLYDPDRIRRPRVNSRDVGFPSAVASLAEKIGQVRSEGKRIVVIHDEHCSPSRTAFYSDIESALGNVQFQPFPALLQDNEAIANAAALGIDAELVPDIGRAALVVSVERDILGADKLALHNTVHWAKGRKPGDKSPSMTKLIVAEGTYSLTGANSDKRYRLHPSELESFIAVIESAIVDDKTLGAQLASRVTATVAKVARAVAEELLAAKASGVLLAGRDMSPLAHAMCLNVNMALGSLGDGKILDPTRTLPNSGSKSAALHKLLTDIESGQIGAVIFCGVNPMYSAPLAWQKALSSVPFKGAINIYEDETAKTAQISIPAAHWMESWDDTKWADGTMSIQQPLIAPLNEGVLSVNDILMAVTKLLNEEAFGEYETYYDYLVSRWTETTGSEAELNRVLANGVWQTKSSDGSVVTSQGNTPIKTAIVSLSFNYDSAQALTGDSIPTGLIIRAVPDYMIGTGEYANNGWMQECPDPVTKITWDNVALMSPATAESLGLGSMKSPNHVSTANEKVVIVKTSTGSVQLPVWVQVGMADNYIVTQLGYGREAGGSIATTVGSNAFVLSPGLNSATYMASEGVETVDGARHRIATTQHHHTLSDGRGDRPIAHEITLEELKTGSHELMSHFPNTGHDETGRFQKPLSITPDFVYKGHRWGMVIDMSACTGCSSCIIACQSENNIAIVGKKQVMLGREMHWIRLDRYYSGDMNDPTTMVEPMLCQHCENAPCENVCPVAATTHSPEGLNEMTYNRCVGTRYCLNNCPYKVRRFNFLDYNGSLQSPHDMVFNPDVTLRMRGVMEKCTFCVQRLHEAKWHAKDDGRTRVKDGEAVAACQEACPTGAIIFGDMNDSTSAVTTYRRSMRSFRVLEEMNVRPSITYLARVRNNMQGSVVVDEEKPCC